VSQLQIRHRSRQAVAASRLLCFRVCPAVLRAPNIHLSQCISR
jgi:hypothetical protein